MLPLIRFRGAVRPVIIAGDRSYVERCIREGEKNKDVLRQRGVSGGWVRHRDVLNNKHGVERVCQGSAEGLGSLGLSVGRTAGWPQ